MKAARAAGIGWCGRSRTPGAAPEMLSRPGFASRPVDPESLARDFPGRWNPRRAPPEGLEPLVAAFAMALEEAGWWRPCDREPVPGALVLGTDSHFLLAAAGFAGEISRSGPNGISPSGFLFSLPSSAAAVLGILFGFRDYQATVTEGGLSGLKALAHALDLLEAGRIRRAAVGAVSAARPGPGERLLPLGKGGAGSGKEIDLAVAFCLEPAEAGTEGGAAREGSSGSSGLPLIEECCILDAAPADAVPAAAGEIDPVHRALSAPSLLAVARALAGEPGGPRKLVHGEPGRPGCGAVRIVPGGRVGPRRGGRA